MINPYAQSGHRVRLDWGPVGARTVGAGARFVAVVDVLSFTTTLTVAADRGVEVFPYRWKDERAAAFAAERDATLAVGRSVPGQVSLSPATVRAAESLTRLVLPSPNGSTIARVLAELGTTVLGVSLRNAAAAAAWVAARLSEDDFVAVIPAGERWDEDGSLRPAVEDLWGAGAFVAYLPALGRSPEAEAAAVAYRQVEGRISEALHDCASGRELIGHGYPLDVAIAAELGQSAAVPVLRGESFRA
ncbi:2-phosphosulfolactate phosphatase [Hamadaea tsunoensis]|uniref:2-phosphosulfolactate phosphatase n=1 Tax=Hamadaea tsunoensis TaxID=53368 RepID=UPI0004184081|nr:2-phosphosulfolactate phosphatase [Hamadaea tsunoensis]